MHSFSTRIRVRGFYKVSCGNCQFPARLKTRIKVLTRNWVRGAGSSMGGKKPDTKKNTRQGTFQALADNGVMSVLLPCHMLKSPCCLCHQLCRFAEPLIFKHQEAARLWVLCCPPPPVRFFAGNLFSCVALLRVAGDCTIRGVSFHNSPIALALAACYAILAMKVKKARLAVQTTRQARVKRHKALLCQM